jgi:agmatine deiminase
MAANTSVRMPAEWEKHKAVWLAWPSAAELWKDNLKPAQDEFTALATAIADIDEATKEPRGELLNILVPDEASRKTAEAALKGLPVTFHQIPFGDIWLRDTAPLFVKVDGKEAVVRFKFNGWGEKYVLPYDSEVSAYIANASEVKTIAQNWVLEGGSIELDGEGTCLTSKQCLLNPNRNPSMDQAALEKALGESLGIKKTLWLNEGLLNDHTDGHIDTIARYIAPATIMCMHSEDVKDPNDSIYSAIQKDLSAMTDAKGRKIKVVKVPSPGLVEDEDGRIMPASYLNFYISNTKVIVPIYGSVKDQEAVAAIADHFPDHETIGLSAKAILSGGGAFHCISQQQPL